MSIPIAIAVFISIWSTVLFAVLPIGVRSQHEGGEFQLGTDPGAPIAPGLLRKAMWTTIATCVIFAGVMALMIRYE